MGDDVGKGGGVDDEGGNGNEEGDNVDGDRRWKQPAGWVCCMAVAACWLATLISCLLPSCPNSEFPAPLEKRVRYSPASTPHPLTLFKLDHEFLQQEPRRQRKLQSIF